MKEANRYTDEVSIDPSVAYHMDGVFIDRSPFSNDQLID